MQFGGTGSASVLQHRYLHGPDGQTLVDEVFSAAGASTDKLWLLPDQQGTVRDIVDGNGVLRKHVDYDSVGNVTGQQFYDSSGTPTINLVGNTAAVDELFYYAGAERDVATGLDKDGARWYSPQTARFLSEDPSGLGPDANPFRYVGNSFPNATDPTGLSILSPLANLPSFGGSDPYGVRQPLALPTFTPSVNYASPNYNLGGLTSYSTPSLGSTNYGLPGIDQSLRDPVFSHVSSGDLLAFHFAPRPLEIASIEVINGVNVGDNVREWFNSAANYVQNQPTLPHDPMSMASNSITAGAIRLLGRSVGSQADIFLPNSEPDHIIHYTNGKSVIVLGGGPSNEAMFQEGLAGLPAIIPSGWYGTGPKTGAPPSANPAVNERPTFYDVKDEGIDLNNYAPRRPLQQQPYQQQQANSSLTPRNAHLAGKTHPVTGIPFDADGYPDFSSVAIKTVKIRQLGNYTTDLTDANRAAGLESTPKGYIWHHNQDGTTMQLVPENIHAKTGHTGGVANKKSGG